MQRNRQSYHGRRGKKRELERDYAAALAAKSDRVPIDPMFDLVQVLHYMHWTYDEYLAQPAWLLEAVRIKMGEDNIHQRNENKAK